MILLLVVVLSPTTSVAIPSPEIADPAEALFQSLRLNHRGPGPCLRYLDSSIANETSVQKAATQLLSGGVKTTDLIDVLDLFFEKANAAEEKAHSVSERAELKDILYKNAAYKDLSPEKLERVLDELTLRPDLDTKKATTAFNRLAKPAKTALLDVWRDYPQMLHIRNIPELRRVMELEAAADRLRRAGMFVLDFHKKKGEWPTALPSNLAVIDGEMVGYHIEKEHVVLSCFAVPQARWVEVWKDGLRSYQSSDCPNVRKAKISRSELQKWIDAGGTGSRVVPAFDYKTGTSKGFKLFAFEPDCFVARLGFCEGDVVQSANDFPLTSPEKVQKAYEALKDAPSVRLRLLRGAVETTIEAEVVP